MPRTPNSVLKLTNHALESKIRVEFFKTPCELLKVCFDFVYVMESNGVRSKLMMNYNRDRGVHELQVNHIELDTSRKELLVGISIDLSKACDKIDHKILITKLKYFRIRRRANG